MSANILDLDDQILQVNCDACIFEFYIYDEFESDIKDKGKCPLCQNSTTIRGSR